MTPTEEQIKKAAEAIANNRLAKRGDIPMIDIMDYIPEDLRDEVMEDAQVALSSLDEE